MRRTGPILLSASVYGAIVLSLIGLIVAESAQTVATGYRIGRLNRIWQEKNFEFIHLTKKYRGFVNVDTVTDYAKKNFDLKFPDSAEMVFIEESK